MVEKTVVMMAVRRAEMMALRMAEMSDWWV